ncbi:MAG: ATP-binding protein [Anaerolineales bacterium]|nr:ATP-binding protein [Anaerolineales bacterium]
MMNSLVLLITIYLLVVLLFIRYYVLSKRRIDAMRRQVKVLTHDLETKSEVKKVQSARWQAASSVLEEALLFIDSELNVLYASPIAVQIFGDISDSGVSIVSYTHSDEFELECRGVVSGETDEELYEWQSEFQDSVFQVRALRFDYGAILALSDVSNLHHLEQARRDMFANISHELRTPLTSIRLLLDMLLTREQSVDNISAIEKMTTETETLKEMAQELLDISLIESGRFAIKLDSTTAAALIMLAIERLQPQAKLKSIYFRVTECTDVSVWADADQIQRVLGNIFHNAIKFTPPDGSVIVSAIAEDEYVRIETQDSGPGIHPDDLPRIFERFFRADRTRKGAGTGLGLAIANHVVQAHGGEIWAENTPETGAMISFTLLRADK